MQLALDKLASEFQKNLQIHKNSFV